MVSVDAIPTRNRLGYWLARQAWGQGYATEAVSAAVGHAFDVLHVPLLRAGVFADNPASLRVLHKLGFRRIGIRSALSLARAERLDFIATVLPRRRYLARRRRSPL